MVEQSKPDFLLALAKEERSGALRHVVYGLTSLAVGCLLPLVLSMAWAVAYEFIPDGAQQGVAAGFITTAILATGAMLVVGVANVQVANEKFTVASNLTSDAARSDK